MRPLLYFIASFLLITSSLTTASAQVEEADSSLYADAYYVFSPVAITPNTQSDIESARERSRWRYRTFKVYPYATRALELLKELDEVTEEMDRKKDRRKYKKQLENELKNTFKEELKGLSKTQGNLLIDMIERQSGTTFYTILKDLKSGTTALFWQTFGKSYGYDLKAGYDPEANPVLEDILSGLEWPDFEHDGAIIHKRR